MRTKPIRILCMLALSAVPFLIHPLVVVANESNLTGAETHSLEQRLEEVNSPQNSATNSIMNGIDRQRDIEVGGLVSIDAMLQDGTDDAITSDLTVSAIELGLTTRIN